MPIFILGLEIISEFVITNEARVILVFLKPKNYHNCRVTKRLEDLSITTLPIYAEKKWSDLLRDSWAYVSERALNIFLLFPSANMQNEAQE